MKGIIDLKHYEGIRYEHIANLRTPIQTATRLTHPQHTGIIQAMLYAGEEVLRLRDSNALNPRKKPDGTWVTDADYRSHEILTSKLGGILQGIPVISEEDEAHEAQGAYTTAFLCDPVDCTGDLIRGGPTFSILLGGIVDNKPCHGFVFFPDPRVSKFYYTGADGVGAYKQDVKMVNSRFFFVGAAKRLQTPRRLQPPKTEIDKVLRIAEVYEKASDVITTPYVTPRYSAPASAIALMEGEVDLVVGCDAMHDWDLAAFDALLRKSGALTVESESKNPLRYGAPRTPDRAFKQPRYTAGHVQTLRQLSLL